MKIVAIVSEYNPFHNGHKFQINTIRSQGATHVVAVMSPNFVQRGDISIFDKRTRVKAALSCGVDLVLELPTPYALSSAKQFAFGAISTIMSLGCIDEISFGSECGDINKLTQIASFSYGDKLYLAMEKYLSQGVNFPSARSQAIGDVLGEEAKQIIVCPNNILGIEYVGQLLSQKSTIKPTTVKRTVGHDTSDEEDTFASASHIRKLILNNEFGKIRNFVPKEAYSLYEESIENGNGPNSLKNLYPQMMYKLRTMNCKDIAKLPDISEGLENRIYSSIRESISIEEIIDKIKTKRYAHSRIRRILVSSLLTLDRSMCKNYPPYTRILGFNQKGREILSLARNTAKIPMSDSLAKLEKLNDKCKMYTSLEAKASDIYSLAMDNIKPCGSDYTENCTRMI